MNTLKDTLKDTLKGTPHLGTRQAVLTILLEIPLPLFLTRIRSQWELEHFILSNGHTFADFTFTMAMMPVLVNLGVFFQPLLLKCNLLHVLPPLSLDPFLILRKTRRAIRICCVRRIAANN